MKRAGQISSGQFGPQLEHAQDYEGRDGRKVHITRKEYGLMPTEVLAKLHGTRGEMPGEHRNRQGPQWDEFLGQTKHGIDHPVHVTVDYGEPPKMSEGNHRRDAAIEHGHPYIRHEASYFGNAQKLGTVWERHFRGDMERGQ